MVRAWEEFCDGVPPRLCAGPSFPAAAPRRVLFPSLTASLPSPTLHQGIDLEAGGRNKTKHRTAPKSENVYIKLLVKVR
jgi:hypothetical protein